MPQSHLLGAQFLSVSMCRVSERTSGHLAWWLMSHVFWCYVLPHVFPFSFRKKEKPPLFSAFGGFFLRFGLILPHLLRVCRATYCQSHFLPRLGLETQGVAHWKRFRLIQVDMAPLRELQCLLTALNTCRGEWCPARNNSRRYWHKIANTSYLHTNMHLYITYVYIICNCIGSVSWT